MKVDNFVSKFKNPNDKGKYKEIIQLELSILAYSCHCEARRKLEELFTSDYFKDEGINKYCFYEYFCSKPFGNGIDDENEIEVYAPFIERIIRDHPVIIYGDDIEKTNGLTISESSIKAKKWQYLPNVRKILEKQKVYEPIQYSSILQTSFGKYSFEFWKNPTTDNKENIYQEFDETKYEELLKKLPTEENDKKQFIREYLLAGHHFWRLSSVNCKIQYVTLPIGSPKAFYGYVIAGFPFTDEKNLNDRKNKLEEALQKICEKTYLPVLILFFECIYERMLNNELKYIPDSQVSSKKERNNISDIIKSIIDKFDSEYKYANDCFLESKNKFEQSFYDLWKNRRKLLEDAKKDRPKKLGETIESIKQSLIFHKYMIASPSMVKIVSQVMRLNLSFTPGRELPSVIVTGEPGSGKDKVARMIPLFSKEYRNVDVVTINMASLKPKEIAAPILSGVLLKSIPHLSIEGIFGQSNTSKVVFILDELNSLDMDSQGTLLRVIENGEVQALGSLSSQKVEFAVIGIMNEIPNELTMEKTLENLNKIKALLGELPFLIIEDRIRHLRRLRPDLHYRLRRGGRLEFHL